jgi:transposase
LQALWYGSGQIGALEAFSITSLLAIIPSRSGPVDLAPAARFRLRKGITTSNFFWLTDAQMARLQPVFSRSHGKPRVDDRRVLSGIIFIAMACGGAMRPGSMARRRPSTTEWKRWSEKGVFARMMEGLASEAVTPKTVMIDAT